VPMILGGDEIGRTQGGNNNAYCQDNEVSWYDWEKVDVDLLAYTTALIALRREHPTFRRRQFFQGRSLHGNGTADLAWFTSEADEMNDEQWNEGFLKAVTIFIGGGSIEHSARGEEITDSDVLWLMNASGEDVPFTLPDAAWGKQWRCVLDTTTGDVNSADVEPIDAGAGLTMIGHSQMVFVHVDEE
jgi:isoamylase